MKMPTVTSKAARFKYKYKYMAYFAAMVVFNSIATTLVFQHTRMLSLSYAVQEASLDETTVPETRKKMMANPNAPTSTIIDSILLKWNLTTTASTTSTNSNISNNNKTRLLLEAIWRKGSNYKPEKDLVVFYHPMKSGGTSLSEILATTMGNNTGGIVPGSKESGYFDWKIFHKTFRNEVGQSNQSKQEWWSSKRVLYSHSVYRKFNNNKNNNREKLAELLHTNDETSTTKIKRIRHITMVRDPLAFVASNFMEWFCQQGHWERQAKLFGFIPSNTDNASNNASSSCPYSLEDRTKARVMFTKYECQNITTPQQIATLTTKRAKQRCEAYHNGQPDPTPECTSIPAFLSSDQFQRYFNDVYADYTYSSSKSGHNNTLTTEDHQIHGALEYLGGLDAGGNSGDVDGDMMWFGITERMSESLCLFHYQTGLPLPLLAATQTLTTGRRRVKACRPTSFWTDADKQRYQYTQSLDHAVFRAANAILDLNLVKMRQDLWSRVVALQVNNNNNNTTIRTIIEAMPFTSLKCMGTRPHLADPGYT